MEDKTGKIKIRRSNGDIQYVTQEQLEQLNEQRKRRDQQRNWGAVGNPFEKVFGILIVLGGITILGIWLS